MAHIFNPRSSRSKRKYLRAESTLPEQRLWSRLRARQINGYKFRRQFGVGNFILDFYCPKRKLAIEVDGDSHVGKENERYDELREKYLAQYGIHCLRFTNHEIMENLDGVAQNIWNFLTDNPSWPPLRKGEGF